MGTTVRTSRPVRALHRAIRRAGVEVGPPGGRRLPVGIRRVRLPSTLDRRAVLRGDSVVVDIRQVVSPYGFSYADGGWHPYWATLRAHLEDPGLEVAHSPLGAFFDTYQPRTAAEALFGRARPDLDPLDRLAARYVGPLWTMSAREAARAMASTARKPFHRWNMNFGPADPEQVAAEFARLIAVLDSIQAHGYAPHEHEGGVIDGVFLVDGDKVRFMPTEGQHRIGALRALGIDQVVVRPRPGLATIRRDDLDRWSPRHGGFMERAVAEQVFARYFEVRGAPGPVGLAALADDPSRGSRP